MIRKFLYNIIIVAFLSSCTSKTADKAADSNNDSIKKYIELASDKTLDTLVRNRCNDKALFYLNLSKNDTLTRFYLSSIYANYMEVKNWPSFKKVGKVYFEKSLKVNDSLNLAIYYKNTANYYIRHTTINDSAFYYLLKTENFYKKIKEDEILANILLNKGIIQFKVGDYLGSELSLLKAYSTYKNSKNKQKLYDTLNELGLVYNMLSEYNKSIFYHKRALETVLKYNLKHNLHQDAICYNNIGYLYSNQGEYQEAIINFELGIKDKSIIVDDPELYALLKSNLAYCKLKVKKYGESIALLRQALKVEDKIPTKIAAINTYMYLSEYYQEIGDDRLALEYCKQALNKAKKCQIEVHMLPVLKRAIIIDKANSKQHIENYLDILDHIQIEERKSKERFNKIQFETNEIEKEKETAIKQKWVIVAISGVIILIVALLLIITYQRAKQKELQLIQSQQKANEEIYDLMLNQKSKEELARQSEKKRIAIELHDGVMNKLASTRLNLNILSHKQDQQTIDKCLTHVEGIYMIEQEIRNIAHDLNTEAFDEDNSFATLLNDFINAQNVVNTQYSLKVEQSINWDYISGNIKMNLYRIIQEASHNINKFANAKNAIIDLSIIEDKLYLSVSDDGKGFDVEVKAEGIGLKNIKQRVETLNGNFSIQSVKNKKTTLNIIIPNT